MKEPGRPATWAIKAVDDQWMLDLWTALEHHVMRQMVRVRELPDSKGGTVTERDYRSVCSCGWRSLDFIRPTVDQCPVSEALRERRQRLMTPHERRDWSILP